MNLKSKVKSHPITANVNWRPLRGGEADEFLRHRWGLTMGADTKYTRWFPLQHVQREAQAERGTGLPYATPIWRLTQVSTERDESVTGPAPPYPSAALQASLSTHGGLENHRTAYLLPDTLKHIMPILSL